MKKLYITTGPILLLIVLFFSTKKATLTGNFVRKYDSNIYLIPIDTISFSDHENIDGITVDKGNLWINKRNHILRYNKDYTKQYKIFLKDNNLNKPIINFYVNDDIVYYYQGNTRSIKKVNTKNRNLDETFNFKFPITYFSKLSDNSFIFQESIIGTAGVRIHYIDFDRKKSFINETIFPDGYGYGMKFSGSWVSVEEKKSAIFCAFHSDFLLRFDSTGSLMYNVKPIDYQNQKLELIKENNLYYLSPQANTIRTGSCVTSNSILTLSNVIGKDEQYQDLKNNSLVDVYSISNGEYNFSFRIPNFMNNKVICFAADNNKIYAVYGKSIILYNIKTTVKI